MYATSPPTPFNPVQLIRKMVLAVVLGSLLAPVADYIQGVGPDTLNGTRDAVGSLVTQFHAAQDTQHDLFRGVTLP